MEGGKEMKRKNRRLRAKQTLILKNKGKRLVYTTKQKRSAIIEVLHTFKSQKWDYAYYRIVYKPDVINEGEYKNYHDLLAAIRNFTNKTILDYAEGI